MYSFPMASPKKYRHCPEDAKNLAALSRFAHLLVAILCIMSCKEKDHPNSGKKTEGSEVDFGAFNGFDIQALLERDMSSGNPVTIVSLSRLSEGQTRGMPAAIFVTRFTWHSRSLDMFFKQCVRIHATHNKEWKTYEDIIVSTDFQGVCGQNDGCGGCGKKPFDAVVKEIGYSGSVALNP